MCSYKDNTVNTETPIIFPPTKPHRHPKMAHPISPKMPESQTQPKPQSPIAYEQSIYTKGLHYIRPQISLKSTGWQPQAEARLSAESKGYLIGNAGTGETTDKNLRAFRQWSLVPRRLVKVEGLPDSKTRVLGMEVEWPVAMAPVGVQRKLSLYTDRIASVSNYLPSTSQVSSTPTAKRPPPAQPLRAKCLSS
jgi:hypothetical protein